MTLNVCDNSVSVVLPFSYRLCYRKLHSTEIGRAVFLITAAGVMTAGFGWWISVSSGHEVE